MNEPATTLPWVQEGDSVYDKAAESNLVCTCLLRLDAAYIVEACNAYPHLLAALRKLVEVAKLKEWDQDTHVKDGILKYCSCCSGASYMQHATKNCPYASAIAEAERLLGDAT